MISGLIDSHAHLSGLQEGVESMISRAQQVGIQAIINICTDDTTLVKGLELHQLYPWIFNAAAIPPHDIQTNGERLFSFIAQHAKQGSLIAIGETGLDYHYHTQTQELQHHFLRRYLHLALECSLPVIIHCREAFADFFHILDAEYRIHGRHAPGVLHCFTGTMAEAEHVIERGWYLSLSGIVTFKKSQELRQVAKHIPLNQLLIETDTPYLAPQNKRGKTNEPSFILETVSVIAEARGISPQEIVKATAENARQLFNLSSEIR